LEVLFVCESVGVFVFDYLCVSLFLYLSRDEGVLVRRNMLYYIFVLSVTTITLWHIALINFTHSSALRVKETDQSSYKIRHWSLDDVFENFRF
jgi:hypothetical protein